MLTGINNIRRLEKIGVILIIRGRGGRVQRRQFHILLLYEIRNSYGVEMYNSHMFALSNTRDYSFSKVPCLERKEKMADLSNFVNNVT